MVLVAFVRRQLSYALDKKPCVRCGKDHMLKNCPMDPDGGFRDSVWKSWNLDLRKETDAWLKAHEDYKPDALPVKKTLPQADLKGKQLSVEKAPLTVDLPKTAMLDSRQDFVSKKVGFVALKNNNQAQSKEIHEIRPDFANTTSPPPLSVLANYFKVELPSASLYKYIVSVKISDDDDGENVPRGKRQERMK
jgi:hypothetical protein